MCSSDLIAAGVLYPVFGILLSPMVGAAAMALSSVSVIGNAAIGADEAGLKRDQIRRVQVSVLTAPSGTAPETSARTCSTVCSACASIAGGVRPPT